MNERKTGLAPVFDERSKVLILGSFPSVKSRQTEFYYGNKQNRFWKMLCGYFKESVPESNDEKKAFLLKHGVALWDMVVSCEIDGSSDLDVKNPQLADLSVVLEHTRIQKILLNGALSYELFIKSYDGAIPHVKMPSTSPANPRYDESVWRKELDDVFQTNNR